MIEIKKEILEHYADLNDDSWKLEINKVSWNNGPPKTDIRKWSPDHEKCGKGLSLTEAEAKILLEALTTIYK
jgi:hypothetical protein